MRIFRDPTTGTKYYSYGAPSDSKDMRVSFTSSDVADGSANSWTSVTPIASGEKHASLFAKITQMFKNVRYLYKLLGTTDFSGLGSNVSGAIDNLGDIIVKGVETTSTASQAYAVNEYMIYDKKLYKVKAAIASGATITVGTNIESANTNVGNELTSLRSSLTTLRHTITNSSNKTNAQMLQDLYNTIKGYDVSVYAKMQILIDYGNEYVDIHRVQFSATAQIVCNSTRFNESAFIITSLFMRGTSNAFKYTSYNINTNTVTDESANVDMQNIKVYF